MFMLKDCILSSAVFFFLSVTDLIERNYSFIALNFLGMFLFVFQGNGSTGSDSYDTITVLMNGSSC